MSGLEVENALTLRGFLRVVRRRKWQVLLALVLVPLVAIALSIRQPKLYQASSRVLLSWQNLANQLTGVGGSNIVQQPDRLAQTQVGLARTTALAERVLAHVPNTGLGPGAFLSESGVSANPNADILIFEVTDRRPRLARLLVNEYAAQYAVYRHQLDNAPILRARAQIQAALKRLEAAGQGRSPLHGELLNRDQTLATMETLQTSNASVIQDAGGVAQVQPRTKRNAILGAVLGLLLGLGLAYLWEALDTRVRDAESIGGYLGGLPLLARLPAPSRRLHSENRLVMLEGSDTAQAESFRMFRTNLEFSLLDGDIRTIMVTSAVAGEGKSTAIANLAIALARSGKQVALVDLDLRRPSLDQFFKLEGRPGATEVALRRVSLDDALGLISTAGLYGKRYDGYLAEPRNGVTGHGSLHVLPAGPLPPDRAAFFDSQALMDLLEHVREQVDMVLIDAPPALISGDTMTLSRKVDGIIVVARLGVVRRTQLQELARLLAMTPARVLGYVATASGTSESVGYEYGYTALPSVGAAGTPQGQAPGVREVAR